MNEWILGDARYAKPRPHAPRPRRAGGFWRRQFDGVPTRAQRWFDVTFGVVMPLLCFYFDPVVFRGGFFNGQGLYPGVRFYAYTISALEMVALCVWLCGAGRAKRGPAVLTGVLLAGSMFSFILGVAILPLSLIGLVVLIGVFGFVPFLTALVYVRNAVRAASTAGRGGAGLEGLAAAALACGFFFALLAPAVAHVSARRVVSAALADVRAGRELSPAKLKALRAATTDSGSYVSDELVWEYRDERDPARRARLAKAYAEITAGGDIERRLRFLAD